MTSKVRSGKQEEKKDGDGTTGAPEARRMGQECPEGGSPAFGWNRRPVFDNPPGR